MTDTCDTCIYGNRYDGLENHYEEASCLHWFCSECLDNMYSQNINYCPICDEYIGYILVGHETDEEEESEEEESDKDDEGETDNEED